MYLKCALSLTLTSQPLTMPAPLVFLHVRWSIPLVPPWVTAFRFLVGNGEAELKPITSSLLLLFPVFLSFLFFLLSSNIVPLSVACWGYSLMMMMLIIIIILPCFNTPKPPENTHQFFCSSLSSHTTLTRAFDILYIHLYQINFKGYPSKQP